MKSSPLRKFAAACIVAAGFCFVTGMYILGLNDKNTTARDFIEYWAAEQQLIHHANPYDVTAILRIERSAGRESTKPAVTFSPPVAFIPALPLGLVGAKTGLIAWLLFLLASLALSTWILWHLRGCPPSRIHLFGYMFAPALACLQAGQLGNFFLLGVVLFLYFHESRPFLAGAALLPCALKPHLFLPIAIVLLLWIFNRKAYRILAGFSGILLANWALTLPFDRHIWSEYAQMMRTTGVMDAFVPTLSGSFRFLIEPNALWLQYLPEAAACAWALWYFWTRRNRWNWLDQGLLLLLVSVACAPYAWFTDESVLLPAVMFGIYRAAESRRSLLPIGLIAGVALIEVFSAVQITSRLYLWTAPAWLAWYLYATWSKGAPATEAPSVAVSLAG
ncbi:MAG: glycosyltransferase 87 family protein [Terriglobia bacterium]|nr:glycosyltransferase 87 family protein [Terriglobia bacterium]